MIICYQTGESKEGVRRMERAKVAKILMALIR